MRAGRSELILTLSSQQPLWFLCSSLHFSHASVVMTLRRMTATNAFWDVLTFEERTLKNWVIVYSNDPTPQRTTSRTFSCFILSSCASAYGKTGIATLPGHEWRCQATSERR